MARALQQSRFLRENSPRFVKRILLNRRKKKTQGYGSGSASQTSGQTPPLSVGGDFNEDFNEDFDT